MARWKDLEEIGIPGIKRRKSDGKYVVSLYQGRERKLNEKTGKFELRENKTTRVVSTLKEAKALTAQNRREKKKKTAPNPSDSLTFDDAIGFYISYNEAFWEESYMLSQKANSKRITAYFQNKDVRSVDTMDVEEFFRWCANGSSEFGPIAKSTIAGIKCTLNQLYKWMIKAPSRFMVQTNPVAGAELCGAEKEEGRSLDTSTLSGLISCSLGYRDSSTAVLVSLAGLSGLRRGEICGLKWDDIDWENGRIHILRQRKDLPNGKVAETLPKGGKKDGATATERKERWAALPPQLSLILRLARKQQEYYSGGIISGSEYVFRSKKDVLNGVVRKPREAERVFHALIDSFGGCPERFRLHDLRHTYISICLNGGVNYLKTAASAGHVIGSGNGNTTTKTYWHDDGSRDVINTFIAGAVPVEIDETTVFDGFFNENVEAGNGTEG